MNSGRIIFAQLMDFLPIYDFRRCVERYNGNKHIKAFSCWDQYLCMAFAQLTYRESLRDIEACLRAIPSRRYHMGIRGNIARSTLAEANEKRDQAASQNQSILWHHRERSEDPDLDRYIHLCARGYHEKAFASRSRTLHYSTNPERHFV
jgi:hypothetical protein